MHLFRRNTKVLSKDSDVDSKASSVEEPRQWQRSKSNILEWIQTSQSRPTEAQEDMSASLLTGMDRELGELIEVPTLHLDQMGDPESPAVTSRKVACEIDTARPGEPPARASNARRSVEATAKKPSISSDARSSQSEHQPPKMFGRLRWTSNGSQDGVRTAFNVAKQNWKQLIKKQSQNNVAPNKSQAPKTSASISKLADIISQLRQQKLRRSSSRKLAPWSSIRSLMLVGGRLSRKKRRSRLQGDASGTRRVRFKPLNITDLQEQRLRHWNAFMRLFLPNSALMMVARDFKLALDTYELWAIPFRLALQPSVQGQDIVFDALFGVFFLLQIMSILAIGYLEEDTPTTKFFFKRNRRKLNSAEQKWQKPADLRRKVTMLSIIMQPTNRNFFLRVLPLETFSILCHYLNTFIKTLPVWIFWIAQLPRCWHVVQCYHGIRQKEFNLDVDIRQVAFFKLIVLILGTGHWVGCIFYFFSSLARFSDADNYSTWVAQWSEVTNGRWGRTMAYAESSSVTKRGKYSEYLLIVYRGLNALTTLNLEPIVFQREEEMLWAIVSMQVQVLVQAYVLGVLFNYVVKTDPNVEHLRRLLMAVDKYCISHTLPANLHIRLLDYFEFQHRKLRKDVDIVLRALPPAISMKALSVESNSLFSRNTATFRGCSDQFTQIMVRKLREVYMMPGEVQIRQGDIPQDLSFVKDGAVEVWMNGEMLRTVMADADGPNILNDVAFFMGIRQLYTQQAWKQTDVTLLKLNRSDYMDLLESYPEQNEIISTNVLYKFGLNNVGSDLNQAQGGDEDPDEMAIKELLRNALERRKQESYNLLIYAVKEGDLDTVKRVLAEGLPVNSVDYDERTTLHMACMEGNVKIVETLIEAGANVNLKDRWGKSPLQISIKRNNPHVVKLLQKADASLDSSEAEADLFEAASVGNLEVMDILITNGVSVDVMDYDLRTPLHIAASMNQITSINFLLSRKADPNLRNRQGDNPLQVAITNGHYLAARLIEQEGGRLEEDFAQVLVLKAAKNINAQLLQMLFDNGLQMNYQDYDDRVALHHVVLDNKIESLYILLNHFSAEPNIKDRWSQTPLDVAYLRLLPEAIQLLASAGGLTNTTDPSVVKKMQSSLGDVAAMRRRLKQQMPSIYSGRVHLPQETQDLQLQKSLQAALIPITDKLRSLSQQQCDMLVRVCDALYPLQDLLLLASRGVDVPAQPVNMASQLQEQVEAAAADEEQADPTSIGARVQQEVLQHITQLREQEVRNREENTALNKLTLQFGGVQESFVQLHNFLAYHSHLQAADCVLSLLQEAGLTNVDSEVVENIAKEALSVEGADDSSSFRVEGQLNFIKLLDSVAFNQLMKQSMPQLKLLASQGVNCLGNELAQGLEIIESVFAGFDSDGDRTINLRDDSILKNVRSPVRYKLLEECIQQFGQGFQTVFTRAQFLTVLFNWLGFEPQDADRGAVLDDMPMNEAIFEDFEDVGDATEFEVKRNIALIKNRKHSTQEGLYNLMNKGESLPQSWFQRMMASPQKWVRKMRLPMSKIDTRIRIAFQMLDTDNDGYVDLEKLEKLLTIAGLGVKPPNHLVVAIRDQLDRKGGGFATVDQVIHLGVHAVKEARRSMAVGSRIVDLPHDVSPYLIHPNSAWARSWDVLMQAQAVFFFFEVPVRICFALAQSRTSIIYQLDAILDQLVSVDMVVRCFRPFMNEHSIMVYDLKKIRFEYFATDFVYDLVAAVPWDFLYDYASPTYTDAVTQSCLRLPKMLRMRLPAQWYMKVLRTSRVENVLSGVLKLTLFFWSVNHVLACLWWFLGSTGDQAGQEAGADYQESTSQSWMAEYHGLGMQNMSEASTLKQYLLSFYWIATTMTTQGLVGAMYPQRTSEVILVCFVMMVSLTVFSYNLGEISNLVVEQDEALVANRVKAVAVRKFLEENQLPEDLRNSIIEHFTQLTMNNQSSAQEERGEFSVEAIFRGMSHQLQVQVATFTCRDFVKSISYFNECGDNFIDSISVAMRRVVVPPDSSIYRQGEACRQLYIIDKGQVELWYTAPSVPGTEPERQLITTCNPLQCINEMAFFFNTLQLTEAISLGGARLYTISKSDFNELIKLNPDEEAVLMKNVMDELDKQIKGGGAVGGGKSAVGGSHFGGSTFGGGASAVGQSVTGDKDDNILTHQLQQARSRQKMEKVMRLLEASSEGRLDAIQRILSKAEVDVDDVDYQQRTALHVASCAGQIEVVRLLVKEYNAQVNLIDAQGYTPLSEAVRHRQRQIADFLRLNNGQLTLVDGSGLLCQAASQGQLDYIKLLLENGVDVNSTDVDGRTALHLAVCYGHLDVVQYLVTTGGASVNVQDRSESTPLQDAINCGHTTIQHYLATSGALLGNVDAAYLLNTAARHNDVRKLGTYFENKVSLNVRDSQGRSPIHLAAAEGNIEALSYLLKVAATNVNAVDSQGRTPLDDAIEAHHFAAGAMLEDAGGVRASNLQAESEVLNTSGDTQQEQGALQQKVKQLVAQTDEAMLLAKLKSQLDAVNVAMGDVASVATTFYTVFLQLAAKVSSNNSVQWTAAMVQMEGILTKNCDKLLTILGNGVEVLNSNQRPRRSIGRLLRALGVRLEETQEELLLVSNRLNTLLPVVMEIGHERKFSFPMLKALQQQQQLAEQQQGGRGSAGSVQAQQQAQQQQQHSRRSSIVRVQRGRAGSVARQDATGT